jgi:hypothetical protein
MTDNYTKRELDFHFQEIKETLSEIREQTIKTNGRVTSLERWKWMMVGGLTLLSFLVSAKLLTLI